MLARFSEDVITQVTHPVTGLPSRKSWLPTVKEVHDACAEIAEPIARRERNAKLAAEQFAARADEPDKSTRSTREELQAKYGENWGLTSLDREARKPAPAPTIDELRAHYARHGLGFKPKDSDQVAVRNPPQT